MLSFSSDYIRKHNVIKQIWLGKDQEGQLVTKEQKQAKINTLNVKVETINQTEACENKQTKFYFKTSFKIRRTLLILIFLVLFWRLTNFSLKVSISFHGFTALFNSFTCGHQTLTKTVCGVAPYSVPCRLQPVIQLE